MNNLEFFTNSNHIISLPVNVLAQMIDAKKQVLAALTVGNVKSETPDAILEANKIRFPIDDVDELNKLEKLVNADIKIKCAVVSTRNFVD
jgi:nitrate reductase NapAB chaperone NapD